MRTEQRGEKHQVIVVGGGPAGSVAAAFLAQAGVEVLLLDRQKFPRDKTCGDGVPNGAFQIINQIPGANETKAEQHFYPINKMTIGSPDGNKLETHLSGENYVIPRIFLDHWLHTLAIEQGAQTRTSQVTGLLFGNHHEVTGVSVRNADNTTADIFAQVVIGADGATSTVARDLGLDKHPEVYSAVAIRAYIDQINVEHTTEFFLLRELLPGYAWVFNTANGRANIGVGMRTSEYRQQHKKLPAMLQDFVSILQQTGEVQAGFHVENIAQWQLPLAVKPDQLQLAFDGALLVGDAGRLINPLTGGGISTGIESGYLAAQTIIPLLAESKITLTQTDLLPYEERVKQELGPTMKKAAFIADVVGRYPQLANILLAVGKLPLLGQLIINPLTGL